MLFKVNPENPQARLLKQASYLLEEGGVLIYHTDTVYGMGCDLYSKHGIEKLQHIKRFEKKHPLTILVPDIPALSEYASLTDFAFNAIKRAVPGPYTFLLPATKLVTRTVLGKKRSAGFRIPDCKILLELLRLHGRPLLNTSVPSDVDVMQDPERIYDDFRDTVDGMVDGGVVKNSPSSVIDLTGDQLVVVREGEGIDELTHPGV
jgi:tRNA threonylcarbamoyl adenosine modification protein (Sua5/YciO/YrdC/YwlC family)